MSGAGYPREIYSASFSLGGDVAPLINTGLLADFRVNSVQDGFADFTNVAFSWVYEAAFSVVFEVWFVIF